jgi:protein SCO1/2
VADQSVEKSPSANSRLVMLGTVLVAVVGAAVILFALFNRPTNTTPTPEPNNSAAIIEGEQFNGVEPVDPPKTLQDFTLTNQDGEPFSLSDMKGEMVLMLFGYTHCPDVCPLTMLNYKKIKESLGEQADQITFVFISVDGERDTPEVMKDYLGRFDPEFIGLTGDEETLLRMGGDYELRFAKSADASGSTENYLVEHNSTTYLIDKEGKLVALYLYGTEADVIAEDIQARLAA